MQDLQLKILTFFPSEFQVYILYIKKSLNCEIKGNILVCGGNRLPYISYNVFVKLLSLHPID